MKTTFFLFAAFISFSLSAQTTYRVNASVQGGQQNGATWADAFIDLQAALAAAEAGDTIWVAAGTYYPTSTSNRNVSFVLKRGVRLYGGFQGTETAPWQRDYEVFPTILSGNIGDPNTASDNSYHVLYGKGLDSLAVLDGFVITEGAANGSDGSSSSGWGGGLLLEPSPLEVDSRPRIEHCRFVRNLAQTGAGVYIRYTFANTVNPVFRNCRFEDNRAELYGGGMYKNGPASLDQPFILEDCVFERNSTFIFEGGGVFLTGMGGAMIVRRCIFEKDSSWASLGGGLYLANFSYGNDSSSLILEDCIFKENYASEGGGMLYRDYSTGKPFGCRMNGCVFERNKTRNGDGAAFYMYGEDDSKTDLKLMKCVLKNNQTANTWTAYVLSGYKGIVNVFITDCFFDRNIDWDSPGGICFALGVGIGSGNSIGNIDIQNSVFARNASGISVLSSSECVVRTDISNCTFYKNNAYILLKSWHPIFDFHPVWGNDCYVKNCIFYEPGTLSHQTFTNNDYMNPNMYYYHFDHTSFSFTDSILPGFQDAFGEAVYFGVDPLFVDPASDDFRLQPCSPAVNAGDNQVVTDLGMLTDLGGMARIVFDTVDLGAYEVQAPCISSASVVLPPAAALRVFPNPAESELFVALPTAGVMPVWCRVWDALGRPVLERREMPAPDGSIRLPVSALTPGMYRVEAGGYWGRFVKR